MDGEPDGVTGYEIRAGRGRSCRGRRSSRRRHDAETDVRGQGVGSREGVPSTRCGRVAPAAPRGRRACGRDAAAGAAAAGRVGAGEEQGRGDVGSRTRPTDVVGYNLYRGVVTVRTVAEGNARRMEGQRPEVRRAAGRAGPRHHRSDEAQRQAV